MSPPSSGAVPTRFASSSVTRTIPSSTMSVLADVGRHDERARQPERSPERVVGIRTSRLMFAPSASGIVNHASRLRRSSGFHRHSPAITQPPQVCFDGLLQFRGLGELGVHSATRRNVTVSLAPRHMRFLGLCDGAGRDRRPVRPRFLRWWAGWYPRWLQAVSARRWSSARPFGLSSRQSVIAGDQMALHSCSAAGRCWACVRGC